MPFASVDTKVDFPALEREVLAFWKRSEVFDKLRRQNAGNKKWSFLDGPITCPLAAPMPRQERTSAAPRRGRRAHRDRRSPCGAPRRCASDRTIAAASPLAAGTALGVDRAVQVF